jgi:hypothetical protein
VPSSPVLVAPPAPALVSENSGSSGTSSGVPMAHVIHNINIKSLVLYTLDLQAHNYTKWHTFFCMMLGCFNLLSHVEDDVVHPDDFEWTKDDLLVSNRLYSTIL